MAVFVSVSFVRGKLEFQARGVVSRWTSGMFFGESHRMENVSVFGSEAGAS